jgi:hypothetical protein
MSVSKTNFTLERLTAMMLSCDIATTNAVRLYGAMEAYNDSVTAKKKRGSSGYMLWLNANREMIKGELEYEKLVGKEKVTLVAKKGGELWGLLEDIEKSEWNTKAREMRGVGEKKVRRVKFEYDVKDMSGDVQVNGYEGPTVGQLLSGKTSVGVGRGKGSFATLSDAVEAANNVGDCSGIVKGKGGYQLRTGRKLKSITDEMWKDYVKVWVKSSIDLEEEKSKASEKKVAEILSTVNSEIDEESVEDLEDLTENKPLDKNNKVDNSVEISNKSDESPKKVDNSVVEESDEELDEESDEDETDVIQWEYKGETYYVDNSNDMVYDGNQDEVGKRIKTKSGMYKLRLCKK